MADWWPFGRSWADEWRKNWTDVFLMSSAAAESLGLPQPGTLPGDPFSTLVDAARSWLIGKKRTLRFAGHDLTMVLTDISIEGTDFARTVGQYGQVRITARDVRWGGYPFERLEVRARNVHLRPGAKPALVVSPVHVEAFVSVAIASRWLATVSPRLKLTLQADVPRLGLAGAPWACLEVDLGSEGRSIRIQPLALNVLRRRVSMRLPAFHLSLPALPSGIVLASVEPVPGGFIVRGLLSEWQRSVARDDIERLMARMRMGKDRLDI